MLGVQSDGNEVETVWRENQIGFPISSGGRNAWRKPLGTTLSFKRGASCAALNGMEQKTMRGLESRG